MANTKNRRARPTAPERTAEPTAPAEGSQDAEPGTADTAALHVVTDDAVESDVADEPVAVDDPDVEGEDFTPPVELAGEGLDPQEGEAENTEEFLKGLVEAILFTADQPLSVRDVARAARIDRPRAQELIDLLCAETLHRGVRVIEVADGFAFRTNPAYGTPVRDFLAQKPVRLSRAQLETLAIVAYRQPVTRPEVDDIRGVDSGAVLKTLLERELLRILGKKDEPGRPMIYGTTPQFLDLFSLKSLRDLPTLREFTELSEDSRAKFELELGEVAPEGPIDLGASERPAPADAENSDAPAETEGSAEDSEEASEQGSERASANADASDVESEDQVAADEGGADEAEIEAGDDSTEPDDDDDDDDDKPA